MTSLIAYNNRTLGTGEFTAGGGTWATSPSIDNLGRLQPQVYASVTPSFGSFDFDFQAQDSAGSGEDFTPQVFALIGHTLPDGAEITFKDGSTELGSVTVSNVTGRPNNAIVVTDNDTAFDTLTVEVTSAGSDAVRIGALWCSPKFEHSLLINGYTVTPEALAPWTRIDTTVWPNERGVVNRTSFQLGNMTRADAHGPDMPNWIGITDLSGKHSPVIVIPDDSRLFESTYGLFSSFGEITPEPVPLAQKWMVSASVLEVR